MQKPEGITEVKQVLFLKKAMIYLGITGIEADCEAFGTL